MTQSIAMLIEASGIQDYVFGSNELAQNIGASELVTQATTDWLFAEEEGLLPRPHNASRARPGGAARWTLDQRGLADGLAAEVVYAGGGNALILFADDAAAQAFAFQVTSKAVRDAPGLRLVLARQSFESGQLAAKVSSLHDKIAEQKRAPRRDCAAAGARGDRRMHLYGSARHWPGQRRPLRLRRGGSQTGDGGVRWAGQPASDRIPRGRSASGVRIRL